MRLKNRPFGFTVGECIVALAILAAMLTTILSIQVVQTLRIGLDNQRMRAEQSLSNLADRILAASPEELTEDQLAAWADEAEQEDALPADTIQVALHSESKPIAGRRFELIWQSQTKPLPEHRLAVWRFDAPAMEDQP